MSTPSSSVEVADFAIAQTFDAAGEQVVHYLQTVAPMGLWAVTRVVNGRQITLVADDTAYGFSAGAEGAFADSPCRAMVAGEAPRIAPDAAAEPAYAGCGVAAVIPLGAYIGTPILTTDGTLFGTLCGFNPTALPAGAQVSEPLLQLLSSLLTAVLAADQTAIATARQLEVVQLEADTDALTGLVNRRAWDRFIEREEARFRRFGDLASVIVMDLDRLKVINDTRGHDAGDAYIRSAADALRSAARSGDLVARLGGDEFGIVVNGADEMLAKVVVDRLDHALAAAGVVGSFGAAPITVVAGFPGAWKAADTAMYEQKRRRAAERARQSAG